MRINKLIFSLLFFFMILVSFPSYSKETNKDKITIPTMNIPTVCLKSESVLPRLSDLNFHIVLESKNSNGGTFIVWEDNNKRVFSTFSIEDMTCFLYSSKLGLELKGQGV